MSRRRKQLRGTKKVEKAVSREKTLERLDRLHVKKKAEIKELSKKQQSATGTYIILGVIGLIVSGIVVGVILPQTSTFTNSSNNKPLDELDLIFQDLNGNDFNIYSFCGSHIILDFMGTTCAPCAQQVEILKQFTNLYTDIIIISASTESINALKAFQTSNSIAWKILKDSYGVNSRLNIVYIPTLVHINPDYQIAHKNSGVTSINTLESWIS
ncbi:MAG: TlpA family protein disulfide reductase [Candidatus Hodarchaeota archaeon]